MVVAPVDHGCDQQQFASSDDRNRLCFDLPVVDPSDHLMTASSAKQTPRLTEHTTVIDVWILGKADNQVAQLNLRDG